ncbi:Or9e60 [Eciton burchellii]|nr:Or9e60 [Eciton burchellii]
MMICIKERYFKYHRIALIIVGLWPYEQSKLVQLQLVLFLGILTSFIIFQFSRLLFVEYSFDFTIKMLSLITFCIFFLINYLSFWVNMKIMRCLLERFQYIYNELQDSNEIAIYDKFGNVAKQFTMNMILFGISIIFAIVAIQCPCFYDMFIHKNNTSSCHLIVLLFNYYTISENHFHLILLHINVTSIVMTFVLVAIGTIMISCIIHICGIFKIASYRFERAMQTGTLQDINVMNEFVICRRIICAVDIHRKAMELIEFFVSNFEKALFILVGACVLCVSFNLYRICRFNLLAERIVETFVHFVCIVVTITHMFLSNYTGQKITNYSNHVFFTVYNISWYLAPLNIQKLILFLLQRGSKVFALSLGGLVTGSLKNFASMACTSISYVTVMYSIH